MKNTGLAGILTVILVSSSPSEGQTEKCVYSMKNVTIFISIFFNVFLFYCFLPVTVGEYSGKLFLPSTGLSGTTAARFSWKANIKLSKYIYV